jgi:hypothetical protein
MESRPFARLASARATAACRHPALIRDLNNLYRALPALHELDCEPPASNGSSPTTPNRNVFAWLRKGNDARARCLVVVNFTPERLSQLPRPRAVRRQVGEVLNSDSAHYGGSNVGNVGEVQDVGRAGARAQLVHSAAGCDLSRTGKLSMRLSAGNAASARRNWDGRGTNFALFSANARRSSCACSTARAAASSSASNCRSAPRTSGTAISTTSRPGSSTAIASTGPMSPSSGHRFNANKLLLDPYAKRLAGRLVWSDAHFAYRTGSAREDLSFDRRDNARGMPKAVVVDETFNWGRRERPNIPWEDTIIYEAHVKGLTQKREDVPPGLRGTYGGLSAPAMIEHLKRLGVTTIELLPIHGLVDDRHLVEREAEELLGLQHAGVLRAGARYAQDNRSTRSAPRWRGCTTPASR